MYKSTGGVLKETAHLELMTTSFRDLSRRVVESAASVCTARQFLQETELKRLATSCEATADESLLLLQKLKVQGKPGRRKSIMAALKSTQREKGHNPYTRQSRFHGTHSLATTVYISLQASRRESINPQAETVLAIAAFRGVPLHANVSRRRGASQ